MAILFHLPNAKFYQDLQGFTDEKLRYIITSIFIYTFMNLLSLLYVHYALKRRFGISALYQLAFTLESEWPLY